MEKQREKLTLTVQEARNLVYGDLEGFKEISDKHAGSSRWSEIRVLTVLRLSDGKFFQGEYRIAASESQEEKPFEYTKPDFKEVFPVEKTVIVYE